MSFKHFKAIMWKSFRLKLYHRWVSIFEILIPIGFTWLCVNFIQSFTNTPELKLKPRILPPEDIKSSFVKLCYAPSTPATNSFMDLFQRSSGFRITALSNDTELERSIYNEADPQLIGIYFRNSEFDKDKLSYVLRQSSSTETRDKVKKYAARAQLILNQFFMNQIFTSQKIPQAKITEIQKLLEKVDIRKFPEVNLNIRWDVVVLLLILNLSIVFTLLPLIGDILEEKNSGIKELMKIGGVREWMLWLCWFLYASSITLFSVSIAVFVLCSSVFKYIPIMIAWIFVILFCLATISFIFTLTSIIQRTSIAQIIYVIYYFAGGALAGSSKYIDPYVPFLKYLYPIGCWSKGSEAIINIENTGVEFSWTSFIFMESPLFLSIFMLLFNIFLYLFLAYYITNINPGKFGTRKSLFFLFDKIFKSEEHEIPPDTNQAEQDPRFFEPPPSISKAVLRIVNLHKHFKSVHSVRGVNLNTYAGETTVLLGHNGAGKTVTMSMITGIISPSSGAVYYENKNVFEDMDEFRTHVGFCPQENRTFPYLSVIHHLLFFGQLKGLSLQEAAEEAGEYLFMMDMESKRDVKVADLSGGMKRKLSLSMAMMGKVEILILDEPTSGMDAESRRSLWDLLMKIRSTRSLILTTHYMMEADVLGDRIAIMNHGVIICHGTPMFLKKAYDSGYELTITKGDDNSGDITRAVQNALPSASVVSDSRQEIVFKLPLTEIHQYSALFQSLESSMSRLNIENMGVTATTMEQVFLKTGGAVVYDPKAAGAIPSDDLYAKVVGLELISQQIRAILKKKFYCTIRDRMIIFLRIVFVTILASYSIFMLDSPQNMDLLPGEPTDVLLPTNSRVLYQEIKPITNYQSYFEEFVTEKNGVFIKGDGSDMADALNSIARSNFQKYVDFVSAIQVNKTDATLLYSNNPQIGLYITIDLFTNVLLRAATKTNKYMIETTIHSVAFRNPESTCIVPVSMWGNIFVWYILLTVFTTDFLIYSSQFTTMERINGFYHIQMMSRLSPIVYWFGTLLYDFICFVVLAVIRLTLFRIFNSHALFIGFIEEFYILILIMFLYGIAGLLMVYTLTSFQSSETSSHLFLLLANFISALIVFIYQFIYTYIVVGSQSVGFVWNVLLNIVKVLIILMPTMTYDMVILNWIMGFYINRQCLYCPEIQRPFCEKTVRKYSYWQFESSSLSSFGRVNGLMPQILSLLIQIPAYSIILILIYTGIVGKLLNKLVGQISGSSAKTSRRQKSDDDVLRENDRVQELKTIVAKHKEGQNIALLVDRLRKNFLTPRVFTAVSDLSFMIERGSCFGLLGVNGAGKTTTFRILTAEIAPTAGDAYINGFRLSESKEQYLSQAGYCSQTNCIIDQLTGREMLIIIAAMKGVAARDRNNLVNKWMSVVGLEEYKHRRCGTYSGGNKRKLCSSMALIGNPRVVFLDEPTTGVDPVSRRSLYDVMVQSKASGQTVVITSHDINECETLCDRLTIMVAGVMKCIGSAQRLKKRYAQGFSALFKIDESDEAKKKVAELKHFVDQTFPPASIILKDEHADVLNYLITDYSLPWSVLFANMEKIRAHYPDVIRDYVLTDVPLEEVFISFAKQDRR